MFKGTTILQRINAEDYLFQGNLTYTSENLMKVKVSKGLITDGASIPRFLWSIIGCPLNGKYVGSAIVHDALYKSHVLTRKESDKLFLEMLKDNGVGALKRNLMYLAVRVGGYFAWRQYSDDMVEFNKVLVKIS